MDLMDVAFPSDRAWGSSLKDLFVHHEGPPLGPLNPLSSASAARGPHQVGSSLSGPDLSVRSQGDNGLFLSMDQAPTLCSYSVRGGKGR